VELRISGHMNMKSVLLAGTTGGRGTVPEESLADGWRRWNEKESQQGYTGCLLEGLARDC
jgi:hypothetical protein